MYYITIWRPRNYYSDRLLVVVVVVYFRNIFVRGHRVGDYYEKHAGSPVRWLACTDLL